MKNCKGKDCKGKGGGKTGPARSCKTYYEKDKAAGRKAK